MSTIVTEIYDALREAGSKNSDVQHEFALLKGEFNTVKWMLATNITLTLLVLGKLFLH